MYEEFYGFAKKPFRMTPDPSFLFRSRSHEEALARMELAVEERSLMLLVGEIGSGKTTLSRVLVDSLENVKPILIVNPVLTPNQFLRTVATRLGADKPKYFKADLVDQVNELVFELNEKGSPPVIIIDEAQLIPGRSTFEEIRLLTNFQLDDKNLMSIILMGQPEIEKRLERKEYEAFRQRLALRYTLEPLSEKETIAYIEHRLRLVGGEPDIFTMEAKKLIYRLTSGIPRKINNLAGSCLLEGFGRGAKKIGVEIVEDAGKDLGMKEQQQAA